MPPLIPPLGHGSNAQITGMIRPAAHAAGTTQYDTVTVISTKTSVSALEAGPYYDPAVLATITQITLGEVEFSHPTGYWGPFDTDDGII